MNHGLPIPERDVAPAVLCAADPCAQDEALPLPIPEAGAGGGAASAGAGVDLRALAGAISRLLSGAEVATPARLAEVAAATAALGLADPLPLPPAPPWLDREIPDGMLAAIAEDFAPEIGVLAERLHGDPWRALDEVTAAALCFVPVLGGGLRPLDCWAAERPDRGLVAAVRRLDQAPPWIWRPEGGGWAPVRWEEEAALPAGCRIGRRYLHPRAPDGAWSGAFDLPAGLPLRSAARRIRLSAWLQQLYRQGTPAELLRARPELRYRAVLEAARAHAPDRRY